MLEREGKRRIGMAQPGPLAAVASLAIAGGLACSLFLIWSSSGPNSALGRLLGMGGVPVSSLPRTLTIAIRPRGASFSPPAAAITRFGRVTFLNDLDTPIVVRSTAPSPSQFNLTIPAHGRAMVALTRVGLYHYYDARTARTLPSAADTEYPGLAPADDPSDVIVPISGRGLPRQGWIAVLDGAPGLNQRLVIPRGHTVFEPKVLVSVAGGTIVVVNRDEYAHNFVVDPASPIGAAFLIDGSEAEPSRGWQRSLVLQRPGLYHVYCTLHTRMAGMMGGWHGVVAALKQGAWAADSNDPMEAWIVVLPATVAA